MRVAIYARYSSENQHETSIEDQVRICRRIANERGWSVEGVYADRAISGATTLRPDYQRLLTDARAHQFDIVVAEGLDRLSPDPEATAGLYKLMSFLGIVIFTRAEGEVTDLHAGLKGMMNALALKDLAIKTHRGIEGRVRKGLSGGGRAYGYRIRRERDASGEAVRGLRKIEPFEAEVVRRIFREFATGCSPRAIARALNAERVRGPSGKGWRDTTIRGHATRKTGILRNELYVGRQIWNKQTYVRDPDTGKRLARARKDEENVIADVPHLRIVDESVWAQVQTRLLQLRESPAVVRTRKTEFWKLRRPKHLFTGLIVCACCGSSLQASGKDYLVCPRARNGMACVNRRSVRRPPIEEAVLEGLKKHLMEPELVKEFVSAFHQELNAKQADIDVERGIRFQEHERVSKKLRGYYDAIADGLRTPGLLKELQALEAQERELRRISEAAPAPAPRLHPKLAERYQQLVEQLHASLNNVETRTEASEVLRTLLTKIEVRTEGRTTTVSLTGDIVKLLSLSGAEVPPSFESSVKVVAGACNGRYRHAGSHGGVKSCYCAAAHGMPLR